MNETARPAGRRVVLVGAGHAHLHIASMADEYQRRGVELLLIDPGCFWYSGLATGMLAGQYSADEDQVDPERLITAAGGRFRQQAVTGVDQKAREVKLENGESIAYDWLSLNVGSEVKAGLDAVDGGPQLWPVKPIPQLWKLRQTLLPADRPESLTAAAATAICVVGGGPTGSELTANLLGLAEREGLPLQITLVTHAPRLLAGSSTSVSSRLQRSLIGRGATVICGQRVTACETGGLRTAAGTLINCDHALLAVGLQAKKLARELDVSTSDQGVQVNRYMQSIDEPTLFAAGDCADFQPRKLPKLGVFGVKAAAIIHQNLLASIDAEPLQPYKPQRVWLAVLNLGNGRGLALWWKLWWFGRASLWLKDRIDRRFMQRYRQQYQKSDS